MKKELYINTCTDCLKLFRSDDPNQHICPSCIEYRQKKQKKISKKSKKKILTFAEILHLANVYYKVNNKYIHYGEIVRLMDSYPTRCICCGATIPEGKILCTNCKKVGETAK